MAFSCNNQVPTPPQMRNAVAVFGPFRFDLSSCELAKHGYKLPLEDQPAQVLRFLIEHTGVVVSREDLRNLLWPDGIHLDYEHGVNKSINKLRTALGDDPAAPRFIATVRRSGYRFIGPVEIQPDGGTNFVSEPAQGQEGQRALCPAPAGRPVRRLWVAAVVSLMALAGTAIWRTWMRTAPASTELVPVPLTAYPGFELSPTFSPDGSQVAFWWDGANVRPKAFMPR